jgi:FkbM family methyltransferase
MKNIVLTKLLDKDFYVYDGSWHCISNHIRQNGSWDIDTIIEIKKYSDVNKIFIDIGTEIGSYSIPISDSFKKVLSFEPNESYFDILKKNIEVSNIKNIIPINKGVLDKPSRGFMSGDYNTVLSETNENGDNIIITTIDEELKLLNINYEEVGFIKIDIEGNELKAIYGAENLIRASKPNIFLETHQDLETPQILTTDSCLTVLYDWGYKIEKKFNDLEFLLIKK